MVLRKQKEPCIKIDHSHFFLLRSLAHHPSFAFKALSAGKDHTTVGFRRESRAQFFCRATAGPEQALVRAARRVHSQPFEPPAPSSPALPGPRYVAARARRIPRKNAQLRAPPQAASYCRRRIAPTAARPGFCRNFLTIFVSIPLPPLSLLILFLLCASRGRTNSR